MGPQRESWHIRGHTGWSMCRNTSCAERSWVLLGEAPEVTGVNLPVPHRGPRLGGRRVLGSPQSTAQLWLPLHPPAGTMLSGRSALPRTPWLLTRKVRSPGGSPQPTPAPHLRPSPSLSSLVSPVPAFPLLRDPCSRLLQARCSGKAMSTLPRRACTPTSVPWAPFCL